MNRNSIVEAHYKDNSDKLVSVVSRRVGNNRALAEEIVQEAYARALKYFKAYNPDDKAFGAWFSTILNNATKDAQLAERNAGGVTIDSDELVDEDPHFIKHCRDKLESEIDSIKKEDQREILNLYFNVGLKPKEIVDITDNTTVFSVKNHIQRFRRLLEYKFNDS